MESKRFHDGRFVGGEGNIQFSGLSNWEGSCTIHKNKNNKHHVVKGSYGKEGEEFHFLHIELEMSVKHPARDVPRQLDIQA